MTIALLISQPPLGEGESEGSIGRVAAIALVEIGGRGYVPPFLCLAPNYRKSVDQVLALLQVLNCEVDLVVRTKTAQLRAANRPFRRLPLRLSYVRRIVIWLCNQLRRSIGPFMRSRTARVDR